MTLVVFRVDVALAAEANVGGVEGSGSSAAAEDISLSLQTRGLTLVDGAPGTRDGASPRTRQIFVLFVCAFYSLYFTAGLFLFPFITVASF